MKKILVALLAFVSISASADVRFNHWVSSDDHINAMATLESGVEVGVMVFKDASVLVGIHPKAGKMGTEIHKEQGEFSVDGQPIKATIRWYDSGGILIAPYTNAGNDFITARLWANQKITIKFKEFEFWISAKGVQKAWNYLNSRKQAI